MAKLRNQHIERIEEEKGHREFKRTIGEYREVEVGVMADRRD